MPVLPTTAYSQAEDALTLARALVNDTSGAAFTDTLLMPLLKSAYRGLQRELAENGVSVLMEKFTSGGSMLNLQPSSYMRLWEWREDKINLGGATQSITVRVRYQKVHPTLTRHCSGADPLRHRCAGIPDSGPGGAVARGEGARRGSAGRGAAGYREFDQSLCASGADDRPATKALWIPAGNRMPIESSGSSPGITRVTLA